MKIKIVNKSKHPLPQYATRMSAGMDLRANLDESYILKAGERALFKTGIHISMPAGYEAQVRSRSGLALKHGVACLNGIGTIDADYTGDVGVILMNHSNENFVINDGDRIAQLVFSKYEQVDWEEVSVLEDTERGEGGFGHTGKQ